MTKLIFREFEPDLKALTMPACQQVPASAPDLGPSFTLDEVEAQIRLAREESWQDGYEAGKSQAQTDADQATNQRIEAEIAELIAAIQTYQASAADNARDAEEEWVALTLEIAERFVPEFLDLYAFEGVSLRLKEALKISETLPRMQIRVSPETEARLGDHLRSIAVHGSDERNLDIVVEPSFGAGQIRAKWTHGELSYDLDATCQALLEILRSAKNKQKLSIEGQVK